MSYLNDVFYVNPNKNTLNKLTNDAAATGYPLSTGNSPTAVLVGTDMTTVVVANEGANSVSIYKSGSLAKTLTGLGKKPQGICEDNKGYYYITFMGSNSVVKIDSNGNQIGSSITVGSQPQGICGDSNGNVYAASYITGVVYKINSGAVINTYSIGKLYPMGICVDKNDNLWIACEKSCIVKINTKTDDISKVSVGTASKLYDICIDKEDNKWVTSYNENLVYKIVGTSVTTKVSVGDTPKSIGSNSDGQIYVMNTGDGTISKLNNGSVITTIKTAIDCDGSFGDITGYKAYYAYKYSKSSGSSSATIADGSIGWDKLDTYLKDLLGKIGTGSGSGSVTITSDAQIPHAHATYDTVKKALDHLLYESPVITGFTANGSTEIKKEIGSSVSSVVLTWSTNKTMKTITLDGTTMTGSTYTDAATYTANKTWTLTATDDEGTSVSKSVKVTFLKSIYFGEVTVAPATSSDILALRGNNLATGTATTQTFNCTGGKYICFAMPTAFGLNTSKFTIGGLANSDWSCTTISHTNASGNTENYDVFVTNSVQNGASIKVVVS